MTILAAAMPAYRRDNTLVDPWTGCAFACPGEASLSEQEKRDTYRWFVRHRHSQRLLPGAIYLIPEPSLRQETTRIIRRDRRTPRPCA